MECGISPFRYTHTCMKVALILGPPVMLGPIYFPTALLDGPLIILQMLYTIVRHLLWVKGSGLSNSDPQHKGELSSKSCLFCPLE